MPTARFFCALELAILQKLEVLLSHRRQHFDVLCIAQFAIFILVVPLHKEEKLLVESTDSDFLQPYLHLSSSDHLFTAGYKKLPK